MAVTVHAFSSNGELSSGAAAALAGLGGGASALNDLTDVDTTGATTGQVLTFDGSEWSPDAPSAGTVTSTSISDSTATGRAVLTAADAATARAAIGSPPGAQVAPGNGSLTPGSVIVLGEGIGLPEGINTSGLLGDGAPGYENVIGGILANVNTATSNIPEGGPGTGDGALTDQNGSWVWIVGGYDNVVNGWAVVLHGFHNKVGAGANHITIAGGSINEAVAGVAHAVISGGTLNLLASGANYAVIAGGAQNTASGLYTVVGGGINNTATARSALVLGGEGNTTTANYAVVAGGINNAVSGVSAFATGQGNTVASQGGTAAGRDNTVDGIFSTALGRGAATRLPGEVAHAHETFSLPGDAQAARFVARATTTNDTPTPLRLNAAGGQRLVLPRRGTWAFTAHVAARRVDGPNESAGFKIEGVIDLQGTLNTIDWVGTPAITVLGRDNAAWDIAVTADTGGGTGGFDIVATGESGKTIRWVAAIDAAQVIAPE